MAITRQRRASDRGLAGLWRRLNRSEEQLAADQVAAHVFQDTVAGVIPIADCQVGAPVVVSGMVRALMLRPTSAVPAVEIDLFDGTSSVSVIWLGRRRIPGIAAGRRLTVHGRLAGTEAHPVIYNPQYELRPAPHD